MPTDANANGLGEPRKCQCDNCEWTGTEEQVGCEWFEAEDFAERMEPGCEIPVGECPKCLAWVYFVEEPKPAPNLRDQLQSAIDRIVAFDKQCCEAEFTPTDQVWDLLESLRDDLKRALGQSVEEMT